MKFDKSSIAIRERSFGEILDLALWVIRDHFKAFFILIVLGAAPWMALNLLLVRPPEVFDPDDVLSFQWPVHALLMVWEAPLATAPLTLYLGQVLFWERPRGRSLVAGLLGRLPQLIVYQVVLRGIFLVTGVLWIFWTVGWVFMSEIILLERTPFRAENPRGGVSTESRRRILHTHRSGDLFGRALLGTLSALVLIAAVASGLLALVWILGFEETWTETLVFLSAVVAGWLAVGYLSVVRFLSYLDQRIRNEGWELELLMWAEKARLEREPEAAAM